MTPKTKTVLVALGILSGIGLGTQLTLGLMMANPMARADYAWLPKTHQHSGYLVVAISLLYVVSSVVAIARARAATERV